MEKLEKYFSIDKLEWEEQNNWSNIHLESRSKDKYIWAP